MELRIKVLRRVGKWKIWGQLGSKTPLNWPLFYCLAPTKATESTRLWRKRVGVEPTIRPAKDRIAGFEGRGDHRTPFASGSSIEERSGRAQGWFKNVATRGQRLHLCGSGRPRDCREPGWYILRNSNAQWGRRSFRRGAICGQRPCGSRAVRQIRRGGLRRKRG